MAAQKHVQHTECKLHHLWPALPEVRVLNCIFPHTDHRVLYIPQRDLPPIESQHCLFFVSVGKTSCEAVALFVDIRPDLLRPYTGHSSGAV